MRGYAHRIELDGVDSHQALGMLKKQTTVALAKQR